MTKQRRLKIIGKVQRVFFRASTQEKARELGLKGWVRNCEDRSVEALIAGDPDAVDALIKWAEQGPPMARVEEVLVEPTADEDPGDTFEVLR